ncbi:MAG: hypothetical protein E7587_09265 [Ruminococcaceae bacterium]|nr:hypothetical protein [Oscillospiraceae bacterium]
MKKIIICTDLESASPIDSENMMGGDKAACEEASEFVHGIECAVVKEAVGRNSAICIGAEEAENRIRTEACNGIKRASEIKPWTFSYPAEIRFHFQHT